MSDYRLYAVTVACPVCDDTTQFVETTDGPVAIDQDVPLEGKTHCPRCGVNLRAAGRGWDVHDEHEVEAVTPTMTDGGDGVERNEHTSNPVDVKLSQEQVDAVDDGEVLLLEHAACGESIRLWKRPTDRTRGTATDGGGQS